MVISRYVERFVERGFSEMAIDQKYVAAGGEASRNSLLSYLECIIRLKSEF